MTSKHNIIFFIQFFIAISVCAQINYLSVDYSVFELKHNSNDTSSTIPSGKMTRFNGNYIGESYHFALGRYNSFSLGLGLTTINYEKQWVGIFRESNQFGAVTLKGSIQYLSLPLSLTIISGSGISRGCYRTNRSMRRFGVNITYVPSFQTRNNFSMNTFGTADSSALFKDYTPAVKEFQHAITIGICNQFMFFRKKLKLNLEPYAGIGSGFFYAKDGLPNFSYGVKLQLAIHLKLPKVRIEKESKPGNYNEKKKELEQKQKEIEQQLNKPH